MKKSNLYVMKTTGIAVATICSLFTGFIGNTAFAASNTIITASNITMSEKPFELVQYHSYSEKTEDYVVSVSIPIVIKNSENIECINAEIKKLCEQYVSKAKERALEYKKIFMATGGTEEEWKKHQLAIKVNCDIKNESNNYLSFVIYGQESWLSSEAVTYYYNLDVNTMQYITLEELLGENYIDVVNQQINQQIKERQENGNEVFFTQEEGGFETISEQQNFYINDAGNVVIVFNKYEIAPGSMGNVEFEVAAP